MMRSIATVLVLTVIYCLTLASFAPGNVAVGALLAVIVMAIFHDGTPIIKAKPADQQPSWPMRIVAFVPFVGITVWEILIGSVRVALIVMGVRKLNHPGIVAVPIGERSRLGVAVTSLTTTIAPGSVVLDVDWERHIMLVHVIDASDPDQIRADMQELYDRYQRKVFP